MSFSHFNLPAAVLKALGECKYPSPTPIQEQAIPKVLAGHDLIASAQTGTGKTAAFILPALQRLSVPPEIRHRGPRVLVLTPTRELATQITDATRIYAKYQRVSTVTILGGMPYREQLRLLSKPVDILVATPGRLNDLLNQRRVDLSKVELLVLDEADRMLDMGFIEDVEKIAAATPGSRQTLLFSATIDSRIKQLSQNILKNPEMVAIAAQKASHEHIEQRLLVADNLQHKNRLLNHLVGDDSLTRAIIFSATKRDADTLAIELRNQGHSAAALHGDMTQFARNKTITKMRSGKIRLLVATDVAARGLDITGVSHVINFDLPKFAEDYVHRIGRTGRAGVSGVAISFASPADVMSLERIQKYTGQQVPVHVIPGLEPVMPLRTSSAKRGAPRNASARPKSGSGRPFSSDKGKSRGNNSSFGGPRKSKQNDVIVEYRNRRPASN